MNQIRLLAEFWMFVVTDFPFSERTKNLTGHVLDLVVTCSILQSADFVAGGCGSSQLRFNVFFCFFLFLKPENKCWLNCFGFICDFVIELLIKCTKGVV